MANQRPTILIGIGGIGCSIVADTYKTLNNEDKKTISAVFCDTDVNDLRKYNSLGNGAFVIRTSTNDLVKDILDKPQNANMQKWFQTNPLLNNKSLEDGAGQIRQLSRMAFLRCIDEHKLDDIKRAMERLSPAGTAFPTTPRIIIVGSIAGGTGAGMMLQLPLYIRNIFSNTNVIIRGLFITPTVCEPLQSGNERKIMSIYSNAYACIKEVNACNINAFEDRDKINLNFEYYKAEKNKNNNQTNVIPYDFLFLIGRKNNSGAIIGEHGYPGSYIEMAKNVLRTQLTPAGSKTYSDEDNLILGHIDNSGMDRFCGAGAVNIQYPLDSIVRYCATRWSQESINGQWVRLDNDWNKIRREEKEHKALNPNFIPHSESEYYVARFEELASPGGNNAFFAGIKAELSMNAETENENLFNDFEHIDKVDLTMDAIDNLLDKESHPNVFREIRNRCAQITADSIVQPDEEAPIETALQHVETLRRQIDINKRNCFGIVEKIISIKPNEDGYAGEREANADYNILNLLKQLHPIAGRYALYRLKDDLSKELLESRNKLMKSERHIYHMDTFDFDDEVEGTQNAAEAFNNASANGKKSIIDIFSNKRGSKLETFAHKFKQELDVQVAELIKYGESYFKVNVIEMVVARIEELLDVYSVFFASLKTFEKKLKDVVEIEECSHDIESQEAMVRFVFASPENKRLAYDLIARTEGFDGSNLSKEIKASFASDIYDLFASYYYYSREVSQDAKQQLKKEMVEERAASLYADSIQKSMEKQISSLIKRKLDVGVVKAIEYEVLYSNINKKIRQSESDINSKELEERAVTDFANMCNKYEYKDIAEGFKSIVGMVTRKSEPFISLDKKPTQETMYWAMNPSVVPVINGDADRLAMHDRLNVGVLNNFSIITDEDFSKNEMICYRLCYGERIENLIEFGKSSKAKEKYDAAVEKAINDQQGEYITPHIDKNWYKEAYLPSIYPDVREKDKREEYIAFVYSLLLDGIITRAEYDGTQYWKYINTKNPYEINIDNDKAPGTYTGLLDSIAYNPRIKKDILEIVNNIAGEAKKEIVDIENDIFNHELIRRLIDSSSYLDDKKESISTVFDLIDKLSRTNTDMDKIQEFKDAIRVFIWDYCSEVSNREEQCKKIYKDVINVIINNSGDCVKNDAAWKGTYLNGI